MTQAGASPLSLVITSRKCSPDDTWLMTVLTWEHSQHRGQPINKICEESSSSPRGGKNKLRPAVMVLFKSIFKNVEGMLKWNINWQHLSQYNHNIVNDCKSVKYPVAGGKVSLINIIKFYHFLPPFSLSRSPFSSRKVDYNKALLHLITPTLRPLYKWG